MKKGEIRVGFTMIEVSLAIAIAGLIFLMVFVALPWFRASQKDTNRREDLIFFIDEVKTFQQRNRGALPRVGQIGTIEWGDFTNEDASSWRGFYRDFLKENFMDPDGENYKLDVQVCEANVAGERCSNVNTEDLFFPNDYRIIILTSATCSNERPVKSSNLRKLAAFYALQSGGFYCINT